MGLTRQNILEQFYTYENYNFDLEKNHGPQTLIQKNIRGLLNYNSI